MARVKQMMKNKTTQAGCAYIRHVLAAKRAQTKMKLNKIRHETSGHVFTGGIKKPRRWKPGSKALHEIRVFQRTTNLVINKAPFQRLVKEITGNIKAGFRFQSAATGALQVDLTNFR